jgi:type VI protein secretion system component VasF
MRPEILSLVHRVLGHGLRLRSLLRLKREPDEKFLRQEHTRLLSLLSMAHEAQAFPDYAGDRPLREEDRYGETHFLGIRYALACWADEVIPEDAPEWVKDWWVSNNLETRLFDPLQDRNWKFWEQAALAEGRPDTDALEGYYLCVMLGFRGARREDPEALERWREMVEPRITKALNQAFRPPPCNPPPRDYAEHVGQEKFKRAFLIALLLAGGVFLFGILKLFQAFV